jgi:hypothetical protein
MLFKTAVSAGRALSSSLLVEISTTSAKEQVKNSSFNSAKTNQQQLPPTPTAAIPMVLATKFHQQQK